MPAAALQLRGVVRGECREVEVRLDARLHFDIIASRAPAALILLGVWWRLDAWEHVVHLAGTSHATIITPQFPCTIRGEYEQNARVAIRSLVCGNL